MNRHRILMLGVATLSATLWAYDCGDGTTEPPTPDPPRPTTVTVSPAAAQLAAGSWLSFADGDLIRKTVSLLLPPRV